MEASAPGPRRSSHRLTARPYSNAGSAETSISIYLSIGSTFFAISHSPKQMELVTQLQDMGVATTTSLARVLRDTGRRDEARAMLVDIYNWFNEGFETADLKDAKTLLDQLA